MSIQFQLAGTGPLYQQIADAIIEAIAQRRLTPEQRLPGSRTLARTLDVHRNTVIAAYEELIAQGWLETRAQRGTYVSSTLPEFSAAPSSMSSVGQRPSYALGRELVPLAPMNVASPRTISLSDGVPDARFCPVNELGAAFRRALRRTTNLNYGDRRGHPRLREQLSRLLNEERGLCTTPDDVQVTQGSQMALYLVARVLIAPGDIVVVAHLGYKPAWNCFRLAGATLRSVPTDAAGMDIHRLQEIVEGTKIRAVYLTPHHDYPTTTVLSAARRMQLLKLARTHGFAIIEDDYDNEVHYKGRPVLPLASHDRHGSVIYIGTLSKTLIPSLRIGYVVAPKTVLERIARYRQQVDRQGPSVTEAAVAELLEDGLVQRHTRKMRRMYLSRRDTLVAELVSRFGERLQFAVPNGGLALWVRAPGIDVQCWSKAALKRGLSFPCAKEFAFDKRFKQPLFRLAYAARTKEELCRAVQLLDISL